MIRELEHLSYKERLRVVQAREEILLQPSNTLMGKNLIKTLAL